MNNPIQTIVPKKYHEQSKLQCVVKTWQVDSQLEANQQRDVPQVRTHLLKIEHPMSVLVTLLRKGSQERGIKGGIFLGS